VNSSCETWDPTIDILSTEAPLEYWTNSVIRVWLAKRTEAKLKHGASRPTNNDTFLSG